MRIVSIFRGKINMSLYKRYFKLKTTCTLLIVLTILITVEPSKATRCYNLFGELNRYENLLHNLDDLASQLKDEVYNQKTTLQKLELDSQGIIPIKKLGVGVSGDAFQVRSTGGVA
jgi:hypothetical protein